MRKAIILFTLLALVIGCAVPAMAYDQTGRLGLGYRFGFHTVMKDPWSLKLMHGGEAKFVVHKNWAVGLTGTYGRTGEAVLDVNTSGLPIYRDPAEGEFGAKLYNYILELGPTFNATPDDKWNLFLTAGAGIGYWAVKQGGDVVKIMDRNGKNFDLKDQRFALMIGGGVEYFLIDNFSIGGALRYHIFTDVLSGFKDNSDREGYKESLDIHSGLLEGGLLATAYFGKCKDDDRDGVCNDDDKCPDTPAKCLVDENGCPIDSDGDGVCDGRDKCPDTPKCAKVDLNGCPIDTDKDGVWDGCDKCPDTPADCKVDASGCPLDADKDGVWDCRDKCPDTPACCKVDANGCPLDSDNDGVCDGCDKCPGTPAGLAVNADGCPKDFAYPEKELILREVQFVVNTWTLTEKAKKALAEVAKSLAAFPHVQLEVQGHTDTSGKREWNDTLAQRRAEAVRDNLIANGIEASRLTAKGYGPDKPKYDNATAEGRSQNRRVELVRLND